MVTVKRREIFLFFCFLILFPVTCKAYTTSNIELDLSCPYADDTVIRSGHSVLYKIDDDSSRHTVAINAGHGTEGGTKSNVLAHPDGSQKLISGSCQKGKTYCAAVSTGMEFKDGTEEGVVTLELAQIVKNLLLENGFNVLMIRDGDDVQLDNIARTVIANKNAEIHIAIHWDGDSGDKGAYFMSVPNITSYRNMEPVKSHWQEHNTIGKKLIEVMKKDGVKILGDGEIEMDLTQTSFSTIPFALIEFGQLDTPRDSSALNNYANALVHGVAEYYDTSFTPSKDGGSKVSTEGVLNLGDYKLSASDKALLEEAMKSWPSEMEKGRIEVIKKALSLIGTNVIYPLKDSKGNYKVDNSTIDKNPPEYLDCSAYVSWVFYQSGFNIDQKTTPEFAPDTTNFSEINKSDLIPGDLALNSRDGGGDTGTINHVGIYFGSANGKNVYLHSTNYKGVSGPQVRHGDVNFKVFFRYTKFGDEMTSVTQGSSSSGGSTGFIRPGTQEDPDPKNGFKESEIEDITCRNVFMKEDGSDELNELGEFVDGLFTLIKIAAPALVIILSTVDYVKAITNSDDSSMKKVTQKIGKRIIFGFLIFLLPFLLDLLFHLFGLYDLSTCDIGGNTSEIFEEDPGD